MSGFLGSAFAAENFSGLLANGLQKLGVPLDLATLDTISVVLITIALSYLTLVFGELVPKQIAMRKAEALALGLSGLISFISKLFLQFLVKQQLSDHRSLSTNAAGRLLTPQPTNRSVLFAI